MRIITHVDPESILERRGLGRSDVARIQLAEQVARLCDPYVPMSAGSGAHMKARYTVAPDGSFITYEGPYAHFQYVGEVMVGAHSGSPWAKSGEPKRYAGRELTYNDAPTRGKEWDKRMMADRGDELIRAFARCVGGKKR